jgi:hypothetical protein
MRDLPFRSLTAGALTGKGEAAAPQGFEVLGFWGFGALGLGTADGANI